MKDIQWLEKRIEEVKQILELHQSSFCEEAFRDYLKMLEKQKALLEVEDVD